MFWTTAHIKRKGQLAAPLTTSVLSTGTCTTTGSKAWEPTALMGCTAWKPCECWLILCPKDVGCVHCPAQHAGKGVSPTRVTGHHTLSAAAELAPATSTSGCPGHDAHWGLRAWAFLLWLCCCSGGSVHVGRVAGKAF